MNQNRKNPIKYRNERERFDRIPLKKKIEINRNTMILTE
jgi:hypothetical protein